MAQALSVRRFKVQLTLFFTVTEVAYQPLVLSISLLKQPVPSLLIEAVRITLVLDSPDKLSTPMVHNIPSLLPVLLVKHSFLVELAHQPGQLAPWHWPKTSTSLA